MAALILALAVLATLLFLLHRLHAQTPHFTRTPPLPSPGTPRRLLILLGSGGHTAEMLLLLSSLPAHAALQRTYVFSTGDSLSAAKAVRFEAALRKQGEDGRDEVGGGAGYGLYEIPRARNVGQSWVTTVWSCGRCVVACGGLLWGCRPEVVVCNGPGSAVVLVGVCVLFKLLGISSTRTIYIESFARVQSLSLSGRLLYPFVDRFVVQWPGLRGRYARAEYHGILV